VLLLLHAVSASVVATLYSLSDTLMIHVHICVCVCVCHVRHLQVAYREFGVHALSMQELIAKHTCTDAKFSVAVLYDENAKVLSACYNIYKLRCLVICVVLRRSGIMCSCRRRVVGVVARHALVVVVELLYRFVLTDELSVFLQLLPCTATKSTHKACCEQMRACVI
jgi:hypothetical protein